MAHEEGKGLKKVLKTTTKVLKEALLTKRKAGKYPPAVANILKTIGDQTITSVKIVRTPVNSAITTLLNLVSLGTFDQAVSNANYDKMFHLALLINNEYTLDKQAVVKLVKHNPITKDSQTFDVGPIIDNLTFNTLLQRTKEKMGDSLFSNYNAHTNNCQDFVLGVLNGNDMNSADAQNFVKQDADAVFRGMPVFADKLAGVLTDIGAVADKLISGGKMEHPVFKEQWIKIHDRHYHFPVETHGGEIEHTQYHKGHYRAYKNGESWSVMNNMTHEHLAQDIDEDKAQKLLEELDKMEHQQDIPKIVEKEKKKIEKSIVKEKKKPRKKKEKKVVSPTIKRTTMTWLEFWSSYCKGKKFGSRAAVNTAMKEAAKEWRAKKGK